MRLASRAEQLCCCAARRLHRRTCLQPSCRVGPPRPRVRRRGGRPSVVSSAGGCATRRGQHSAPGRGRRARPGTRAGRPPPGWPPAPRSRRRARQPAASGSALPIPCAPAPNPGTYAQRSALRRKQECSWRTRGTEPEPANSEAAHLHPVDIADDAVEPRPATGRFLARRPGERSVLGGPPRVGEGRTRAEVEGRRASVLREPIEERRRGRPREVWRGDRHGVGVRVRPTRVCLVNRFRRVRGAPMSRRSPWSDATS